MQGPDEAVTACLAADPRGVHLHVGLPVMESNVMDQEDPGRLRSMEGMDTLAEPAWFNGLWAGEHHGATVPPRFCAALGPGRRAGPARALTEEDEWLVSRRERKKVEMLFPHLKRILRLDRLRLRAPCDARDEFHLAAAAQNIRRLAKITPMPVQPVPA